MKVYIDILEIVLLVIILFMFYILKKVQKSQIKKIFIITLVILFWICLFLIGQYWFNLWFNIPLIYFEYFMYVGTCFLPLSIFFTSLIFTNTKIKFKKIYLLLFIIPIISLLILWTNNLHHLFYVNYSIDLNETVFGSYMTIHSIYSYVLLLLSIVILIRYSIKNAGFFSKQSLLFCFGSLIPIIVNILGTFNIIPMTIYITPISFAIAIFCYALAIFKFKFLSTTPIAMQRIVDRMSDSFIVINEDNVVIDFNDTLLKTFNLSSNSIRNQNFINFLKNKKIPNLDINSINETFKKCKSTTETYIFARDFNIDSKYFNIEVSGIFSKNSFLGTLILLKDVTQHVYDMKTIEENQDIIMEQERLASLGQMIGGIAHNLKTPIMSISGALEGLTDLVTEYDNSIEDKEVTAEDHHEIASDMTDWIDKIKTHLSYMSDVITAIKGQAVGSSGTQIADFTIDDLIKQVQILMKHELSNALINLNVSLDVNPNSTLRGNINSLVQVINNMISNSIQAYNGKQNQDIGLDVSKDDNNIIIAIKDNAGGLPEKVKDKLFKEMITTKGKNGTGLGLFMSHSNIKAHFNGNITFESEDGKGTVFYIIIPI